MVVAAKGFCCVKVCRVLLTPDRRPVGGRCHSCYEYRRKWGHDRTKPRVRGLFPVGSPCMDCGEPCTRAGMCDRCYEYLKRNGKHRPLSLNEGRKCGLCGTRAYWGRGLCAPCYRKIHKPPKHRAYCVLVLAMYREMVRICEISPT